MESGITGAAAYLIFNHSRTDRYGINLSAATAYYLNIRSKTATAGSINLRGSADSEMNIVAIPAGV